MHGVVSTVLHLQDMSMSLAHVVPHFVFVYVGLLLAKETLWSGREVQATLMTHRKNGGQKSQHTASKQILQKCSESQPSGERH